MSDALPIAWHVQAQSHAGTRHIILDPDCDTIIGLVVDQGAGVFTCQAFGPQHDPRRTRASSGWSNYGGTVDKHKADVALTLRDLGWTLADDVAQAA